MIKRFKIFYRFLLVGLLFLFSAQLFSQNYNLNIIDQNGIFSALTKDNQGNIYAIKMTDNNNGAVVKYNTQTFSQEVIYNSLTTDGMTYAWGLAVALNGDVYVTTSFDNNQVNKIVRLVRDSNYSPIDFQTGNKYFTGLAFDRSNNLYSLQYNASNKTYQIVKYQDLITPKNTGTIVKTGILSGPGLSYPTSLSISPNGDIYYNESFNVDGSLTHRGGVTKVFENNPTSNQTIYSNTYTSAVHVDDQDNVYAFNGTGSLSDYKIFKNHNLLTVINTSNYASSQEFIYPWGIVKSGNDIFFIDGNYDQLNGRLAKLTLVEPAPVVISVSSTNPDGKYKFSNVIPIQVYFDQPVFVTGIPQLSLSLSLNNNPIISNINYVSGSGTNILTFNYQVGIDEFSEDLNYVNQNSLFLNNGTIKTINGTNANLILPDPSANNSLGKIKNLRIDGSYIDLGLFYTGQNPIVQDKNTSFLIPLTINKSMPRLLKNMVVDLNLPQGSSIESVTSTNNSQISINSNRITINNNFALPSEMFFVQINHPNVIDQSISATLDFEGTDPNLSNNIVNIPLKTRTNDLSMAAFIHSPLNDIDEIFYLDFTVNNLGTDVSNQVNVQFTLPSGIEVFSVTPSNGIYDSNTKKWSLGNISPGTSNKLQFALKGKQYGNFTMSGLLSSSTVDLNTSNDTGESVVTIKDKPKIISVSTTASNGKYYVGDIIPIKLTFDRIVRALNKPQLQLETGSIDRFADYSSGSGTNELIFNYQVHSNDLNNRLDIVSENALSFSSWIIEDVSNLESLNKLPFGNNINSLATNHHIQIDGLTSVWNNNQWNNGVPTIDQDVILRSPLNENLVAKSLIFENDMTIPSGINFHIKNGIETNNHEIVFENGAYLLQDSDTAINNGSVSFKRNSSPVYRLETLDWSSPVSGQKIHAISPNTLTNRFYRYSESLNNWINNITTTDQFGLGEYIAFRAPNDFNNYNEGNAQIFEGTFTGIPNNGTVNIPVSFQKAGNNSVGNPYASPIDLDALLAMNSHLDISSVYIWTHNNHIVNGEYQASNWITYNGNDWSDPTIDSNRIGVGQGFIVQTSPNATYPSNLIMNNSLRRFTNPVISYKTIPEDKFWISFSTKGKNLNYSLIGFYKNSTKAYDKAFDSKPLEKHVGVYSMIDSDLYTIQGRGESPDFNDRIKLAVISNESNTYTISLAKINGNAEVLKSIYLIDKESNKIIDLRKEDYSFLLEKGQFDDRFELVFNKTLLATNDLIDNNKIDIYSENNTVNIRSTYSIKEIKIYNLSAQLIKSVPNVNLNNVRVQVSKENKILVVAVELNDGTRTTKKVIIH